ncbi:hypothetical protein [Brachybacterium paraconglomeratum]|uniref:hypothetical protein n=1 Tax=Brachybacterium paraconglomeratum TaxID=173362 RepID=UPI0031E5D959
MLSRRGFVGVVGLTALALTGTLSACSGEKNQLTVDVVDSAPASAVLPGEDLAWIALTLSAALFLAADGVLIATPETLEQLAPVSSATGLPLLVGTDQAVAEEISRLGAGTVLTAAGTDLSGLGDLVGDLEVVEIDSAQEGPELPAVNLDEQAVAVTLLVDPEAEAEAALPTRTLASAVVQAVGGSIAEIPSGVLGRSSETIAAVTEAAGDDPATGVLALGASFAANFGAGAGAADDWPAALDRTLRTPQLPGGGHQAFPGRRMVAAYGSPGVPSLGILGEQSLQESITRVQELAAEYAGLAEEPVLPAFEIITTMASSEPGGDGNYSTERDPELLREWVDAAGEAGVYVVLDLQPGTTDFLTQARLYEDLLLAPHVGLALDAEWRLEPGQKHLAQIGSVSAAEVNDVASWLAALTTEHSLPQKLLILHQFTHSMISDRQDIDTSHPELAITLHADGHGVPGDKLGTYRALQRDLPEGIFMAWKNFYDEDTPMFTPQETYEVEPRPWFVSYQ